MNSDSVEARLRNRLLKFRRKVIRLELNDYASNQDIARLINEEIAQIKLIIP